MGWSVLIAPPGSPFVEYDSYADFEFVNFLYHYGAAQAVLTGLDGNATPAEGDIIKFVWDRGLASEQTWWTGFLVKVQQKQQGNVYVLRAFTLDALLDRAQTGQHRNYLSKTPFAIIQTAGSPNPLNVNDQGTTVITYGNSGAVPNRIHAGQTGTSLAQFVSDSTSLFRNMKRLAFQSRFGDGSYGLEWTTTLEGANSSSPRLYLMKRRERAAVYTPEVFNITDDLENVRRGAETFPGADTVRVIGGGDGDSRIDSGRVGTGDREVVTEDKAIFQTTNAVNLANRLLEVYDSSIEVVVGTTFRHASPSRCGDTVTITQAGKTDADTRVMYQHYSLKDKVFQFGLGRPVQTGRERETTLHGITQSDTTTPQYTDVRPDVLEFSTQFIRPTRSTAIVVAAGATATVADSAVHGVGGGTLSLLGLSEGLLIQAVLFVDVSSSSSGGGTHVHTYDKTDTPTGASGSTQLPNGPHAHDLTYTSTSTGSGSGGSVALSGPFLVEVYFEFGGGAVTRLIYQAVFPQLRGGNGYGDMRTYQFAVEGAAGDFTPSRAYMVVRNDGDFAIQLNAGTLFTVWKDALHRHNEL